MSTSYTVVPFPYIPEKVDPDKSFLNTDEIKLIKESHRSFYKFNNSKGETLQTIQIEDAIYVIPQTAPYLLGKGGLGEVRLAKNIKTGDWIAVKKGKVDPAEIDLLTRLGEIHFSVISDKIHYVGMKLLSGKDLLTMIEETRSDEASPFRLFDISISLLQNLETLHLAMLLHRDIKPENVMYDPLTHKARLTDYGLSAASGEDKKVTQTAWVGTPHFRPPEHVEGENYVYTDKTDVYAMGLTLGELFELTVPNGEGGNAARLSLVREQSKKYKNNKKIPDPETRKAVYDFLSKMLSANPEERPTATQAQQFFRSVQENYLPTLDMVKKIAYLDLNIYLRAEPNTQKKMIETLKNAKMDEVLLLDSSKEDTRTDKLTLSTAEYAKIQHEFRKQGLIVSPQVIQGGKPGDYQDVLNDYYGKLEKRDNHIHIIQGIKPNGDLTSQPVHVSNKHLNIIMKSLHQEWVRLKDHKPLEAKYEKRAEDIARAVSHLGHKFSQGELTYDVLIKDLKVLQGNLLSQSALKGFLNKKLGVFETDSQKNIKQIIKEVDQVRSHPGKKP